MTEDVSGQGLLQDRDALFLDFDGTLAEIQDDADAVALAPDMHAVLLRVAARLDGALAIVSGRGLSDLSKRVPSELWRFGNHGLFAAAPGEAAPDEAPVSPTDVLLAITAVVERFAGARIEPKGPVIAVHYRAAPEVGDPLGEALAQAIFPIDGYKLQHGKCVYEAKPSAANKGACLVQALSAKPFHGRRPVMIGDDTTDEDAFSAAQTAGGIAIKVGTGNTVANYRVAGVDTIHQMLKECV